VIAKGDPHLTNVYGQHFDLMKTGAHVFVHVPRHTVKVKTLLMITAEVLCVGASCADMYIQAVNITGHWVRIHKGLRYRVGRALGRPKWNTFNTVGVKIVYGRTNANVE